ncbi:asparagine synthase (glutamine-hydrolyzing) [Bacillus solimangrovi]|uniref:asparagine synthase (glutamine-hydrolyzing) n=1 Tax=Bacillus solimangrovi TaxID=1305675 RepID=A0A1E5LDL9_9BACI|nr:asparagine synthase (glutamine-hydrolyzing) [Bacillus solimangrovi]OEH92177.1 asparagine synthase (glutamine-hydrolyzing) [Bacillus solimangrovi]
MCGFVGVLSYQPNQPLPINRFMNMTNIITHRGPDDEGYYEDDYIQMGFRRLSIIDLEGGHQPLSYENQRYWITFNGEIYNYVELRAELEKKGFSFATDSDTETILALYAAEGQAAVKKLRGMFGFVIWDKEKQEIFAARDPFGIKPFFYIEKDDKLYFGSEKKSLLTAFEEDEVNTEALQHYLTYQYVPEPLSLSKEILKLTPGHYMHKKIGEPLRIEKYWQANFKPVNLTKEQAIKEIKDVMYDSVNVHMRSDVPVGSFLSGGIDSTAIASIAKEYHPSIKTFSVGFEHEGFSEVDVAKETADKLGVENIQYIVSPEEYMKELPKIMWHMDDPLADPAAVPLYFVAREASKHVKVVLSGEGADELFGGYNIYREPYSLKMFESIPNIGKKLLKIIAQMLPQGVKGKSFIERGCTPIEERYVGNAKMFLEDEKQALLKNYHSNMSYQDITAPFYNQINDYDDVNKMQFIDIHTWMRGDILLKADKMTMAHSLELRVPFLDKEVFNTASKLSADLKIANNTTKYILREAMMEIIPEHVINRRKLGFPVPIRHWLKNEMYDWAVKLIHESQTDDLLNKQVVLQLLEDHRQGKFDYSRKIWTVLMFMLWHQIYIEKIYSFDTSVEDSNETEAAKNY